MGQHYVEMALVDRDVDGLAHGAAGVTKPRRHERETDEVPEILKRGIAPPAVKIGDEGRTITWHQHYVIAAQRDASFAIARVKHEGLKRRRAQCARLTRFHPDTLVLDTRSGGPEECQGDVIPAKVNADGVEDPVRLSLDGFEHVLVKGFEGRQAPPCLCHLNRAGGRSSGALSGTPPAACRRHAAPPVPASSGISVAPLAAA